MTHTSSTPSPHAVHSDDASAENTPTNGGENRASLRYQKVLDELNKAPKYTEEWFRLKEEEQHLRSHHDIGLVRDSSRVENAGEPDGKGHNENVSTLEGDQHEIPRDSRISPTVEKSSKEDCHTTSVISNDFSAPSFTGSTANESNLLNPKGSKERVPTKMHLKPSSGGVRSSANISVLPHANVGKSGIANTGRHKSPTTNVQSNDDVIVEFEPLHSKAVTETPIHMFDTTDNETRSLHSNTFQDTKKSKETTSIEPQSITDDECPLPQIGISLADPVITEKLSGIDAAAKVQSKQSCGSKLQHPSGTELDDWNHDESFRNNEDLQPRTTFPEPNMNYGLHLSPPASNRSRTQSNVQPRSVPNESVHGNEEEEEAIVIPEAVLVNEDAPLEVVVVGIADLVEPSHTVSHNKQRASLVFVFFGITAIVLGVIFIPARGKRSSAAAETASSLSPATQPSFSLPSAYSSFESLRSAIEKNVLQRNVTFDRMESSDARVLALDWITDKDTGKVDQSALNIFQRYVVALLAFEFSSQRLLSHLNECKWSGVACDENGHVIKLELNGYYMDGTIPPEIGRLPFLEVLSLTDNILHGTLPLEISNLRKLTAINLTNNEFTGSLPTQLGLLKSLTVFSINGNQFTGRIESGFGLLSSLTYFYVSDNKFTGTLPSELGLLKALTTFSCDSNHFTGTLLSELGRLKSLTSLSVADNQFIGTLPSELGLLTSLTFLSVGGNQFAGSIPHELGLLTLLTELMVNDNQFTGTLPSKLGLLKSLQGIGIDFNRFTGTLHSELGLLTSLTNLAVNGNQFTGTLPSELGNLTLLTYLDISENQFTGTFPSQMKRYFELSELSLSNNNFVGTLPSWIEDLQGLKSLRIDRNNFNGTLPSALGKLITLTSLDISHNEFTGTFPAWIGSIKNLSLLWLEDNQFTGSFPSEVEQNLDLEHICLYNNNFTSLPVGIENYSPYFCS